MEEEVQRLLDAQWDSLEARDIKIRKIRVQLGQAFSSIADTRSSDIDELAAKLKTEKSKLHKVESAAQLRAELESKLHQEEQSPLLLQSQELTAKVEDLDKRIAALQAERAELSNQLQHINSTIASRTAKFKDAIADLDKSCPPNLRSSESELKQNISKWEAERRGYELEKNAASDGRELWLQVCSELDSLDAELKGLKRSQLPQISFLLTKTAESLDRRLYTASEQGWSALVVAIGHELQILHETIEAVQKTESDH